MRAALVAAIVAAVVAFTAPPLRAATLADRVTELARDLGALRDEVSTLRKALPADMSARLERVDATLRRLEEDLAFLQIQLKEEKAETETVRRIAARSSAEITSLKTELAALGEELTVLRRKESAADAGDASSGIRLRWLADLRLRGEILDDISGVDPDPYGPTFLMLARARVGLLLQLTKSWGAGFRFTTRSGDPRILEVPLAGATDNDAVPLGFDRAFLAGDIGPLLRLLVGSFENPLWSSGLTWDPDFPFSGAAARIRVAGRSAELHVVATGILLHQSLFLSGSAMGSANLQVGLGLWGKRGRLEAAAGFQEVLGESGLLVSLADGRLIGSGSNTCVDGNAASGVSGCGDLFNGIGLLPERPRIAQWRVADFLVRGTLNTGQWRLGIMAHAAYNVGSLVDNMAFPGTPAEPLWRLGLAGGLTARHPRVDLRVLFSYVGADATLGAFRSDDQFRPGPGAYGTNLFGWTLAAAALPIQWARLGIIASFLKVADSDLARGGYAGWGFDLRLSLEVGFEGKLR